LGRRPTVERIDERFDYGEMCIYAIGFVNGLEVTVIYTDRVSARVRGYGERSGRQRRS
jgi:hypothetical protein